MPALSYRWLEFYDGMADQLLARFEVANGHVLEIPEGGREVQDEIKQRLQIQYAEKIKEAENIASKNDGAQVAVDLPIEGRRLRFQTVGTRLLADG